MCIVRLKSSATSDEVYIYIFFILVCNKKRTTYPESQVMRLNKQNIQLILEYNGKRECTLFLYRYTSSKTDFTRIIRGVKSALGLCKIFLTELFLFLAKTKRQLTFFLVI